MLGFVRQPYLIWHPRSVPSCGYRARLQILSACAVRTLRTPMYCKGKRAYLTDGIYYTSHPCTSLKHLIAAF